MPSPSLSSRTPSSHRNTYVASNHVPTAPFHRFTSPASQRPNTLESYTVRHSRLATPTYYYSSITLGSVFADPSHVYSHAQPTYFAVSTRQNLLPKPPTRRFEHLPTPKHACRGHARRTGPCARKGEDNAVGSQDTKARELLFSHFSHGVFGEFNEGDRSHSLRITWSGHEG
jgi:hypothetical protein